MVRRRLSALALAACAALLGAGCIELQRTVEVTPGAVPAEIDGARWPSLSDVSYCVVPDDSGFLEPGRLQELVADAFEAWGVGIESDGECAEVERGNGRNEVSWGVLESAGTETPHEGVYQAGITRQLFRSCPGGCESGAESEIAEADILLTPSPPDEFQTEDCLFATVLHETGHFLGVPHLNSPAVMAPATSECPQELTDADREALAELYPEASSE